MLKTYHFVAGMPRSGSTLLCNILAQNPAFAATGTSPLPGLLMGAQNAWNNSPEAKANYEEADLMHLLRSIFDGYRRQPPQQIVFEKSRGWPMLIELLRTVLDRDPKILVCTRDMPSIVASCEKIYRKELAKPRRTAPPPHMVTQLGRIKHWTSGEEMVGTAYNILRDAVHRGHRHLMHRVDFNHLTAQPEKTLKAIHEWLEVPAFEYDFKNIEQKIRERDEQHGFSSGMLHTIRSCIELPANDAKRILGAEAVRELQASDFDFLG